MTETKTNLPADFANLFLKGVERAAELQKKSLDAAAQQNAEVIATYQKGPQVVPAMPNVFELAGKAFEGYIEAQKSVIDQMVKQTAALVQSAKESGNSAQKVAEDFTKTIQPLIEHTVEAQKKALELVAQQAKTSSSFNRSS
jgi:flagellar hook-basal body complex protein FliE